MSKINSLSPGLLAAYVRNQPDVVKANVYRALGIVFSGEPKINSGIVNKPQ